MIRFLFILLLLNLHAMTKQEKVGQVFISCFHGEHADESFLREAKIGNVILFTWANGLTSPEQTATLSSEVRQIILDETGYPPLIAIDQEGGRVCRLKWLQTPSAQDLAKQNTAEETGRLIGHRLSQVGINLNFAPVVDVTDHPPIGDRSFGSSPEIVIKHASQMIAGLHESGTLTTLKHFPGHGEAQMDSHLGLGYVNQPLKNHLAPFFALKDQTDAIMTAHVIYPALDPENPATLSRTILTDLLRNEWNYQGLIISDSLVMRGIAPDQATFEETVTSVTNAALKAFDAGCDLLIIGKPEWADYNSTPEQDKELIKQVMANFANAVDEERLDASLTRVLMTKDSLLTGPSCIGSAVLTKEKITGAKQPFCWAAL